MSDIDFGRHSQDYAVYRPGFPASFYRRLDGLARIGGTRALDLATGPGTVALELAERGSTVVGVDVSAEQIAVRRGSGTAPAGEASRSRAGGASGVVRGGQETQETLRSLRKRAGPGSTSRSVGLGFSGSVSSWTQRRLRPPDLAA